MQTVHWHITSALNSQSVTTQVNQSPVAVRLAELKGKQWTTRHRQCQWSAVLRRRSTWHTHKRATLTPRTRRHTSTDYEQMLTTRDRD